jgi:hypothetical protein
LGRLIAGDAKIGQFRYRSRATRFRFLVTVAACSFPAPLHLREQLACAPTSPRRGGARAGGTEERLAAARARRLSVPARGGLGEIGRIYV